MAGKIVGIAGLAGSGKDTVGEILRDKHDYIITSFAWPIKKMICEALLGVSMDRWGDRAWREKPLSILGGKSPRYLAQTLGTEWGREAISNTLWLDLALERIQQVNMHDVAITDLRFENEASKIRSLGGTVVHVFREFRDVCHAGHASEQGIKAHPEDYVVYNNDGRDELRASVAKLADCLARQE